MFYHVFIILFYLENVSYSESKSSDINVFHPRTPIGDMMNSRHVSFDTTKILSSSVSPMEEKSNSNAINIIVGDCRKSMSERLFAVNEQINDGEYGTFPRNSEIGIK